MGHSKLDLASIVSVPMIEESNEHRTSENRGEKYGSNKIQVALPEGPDTVSVAERRAKRLLLAGVTNRMHLLP